MAAAFDFYAAPAVAADTEGVPAHKLVHKEAKEATCREEGNREHYQCEICGKLYEDERGERETSAEEVRIAKKAHEEVKDEGREATCTEAGLTEGKHCKECGEVTEEQKVIPAKGHREKTTAGKEATCTEAGLTEGKECEECGEVLKEQREVPALGHRLKYVAEEKATCTEDGMEAHYACERCGKKYREEGGQEEGDHDRQEKGASQLLQADALVGGDGLCKKEHHIYKQAAQGGQTLSVVVDPEGDQARQHNGVAGDAGVLQKAGRPEHLMHRDHGQAGNQQAQGPGVGRCNSVDEHQQQRDKDHRHKDSLAHCHTPPNRRSRL